VLLGDTTLTNMTVPLSAGVFDGTDRYLRVWFSENNIAYELLSPDRRIAAVPYALQAQEAAYAAYAADAGMLDGQQAGSFQTRVSGFCPVGSTVRAINPDGTVVCQAGALSRAVAPTGNVSATLAVASEYGPFPSLTIGTDGLGLISYCTSSGNLAVRHCDDLACTSTTGASLGVDCDYDYPPLGDHRRHRKSPDQRRSILGSMRQPGLHQSQCAEYPIRRTKLDNHRC
jgi:hypothetical protein